MSQRNEHTSTRKIWIRPRTFSTLSIPMLLLGLFAACGSGTSTPGPKLEASNVMVTVESYVGENIPKCTATLAYSFSPAFDEDLIDPSQCDPEPLEDIHSFEDVIPKEGVCTYKKHFTNFCPYKYHLQVSASPWVPSPCPLDVYEDWKDGTLSGRHAEVALEINSSACDVSFP